MLLEAIRVKKEKIADAQKKEKEEGKLTQAQKKLRAKVTENLLQEMDDLMHQVESKPDILAKIVAEDKKE